MVKAFYQSAHYEPIRDRAVTRTKPGRDVVLSNRFPAIRTQMMDYFEERSFERIGVLHGEYLVHPSGVLLLDRDGFVTATCVSLEDPSVQQWVMAGAQQFEEEFYTTLLRDDWDSIEVGRGYPLLCDPYDRNYYHFSLELAPRARFFPTMRFQPFVTSRSAVTRPFQIDLLQRCLPSPNCHILDKFIKIRDPLVSHDAMSEEGIAWLRGVSQISARSGGRRLYVRRSGRGTRSHDGGSISETPEFMQFLADHRFECVEFGQGDLTVAAQVELLEGAGVILCAHGAALSNLAYIEGSALVIEIIGPRTSRAMFLHLASMLGLRYYGLISCDYDEGGDIVVDLDELGDAMRMAA